jgi:hypothetical protein
VQNIFIKNNAKSTLYIKTHFLIQYSLSSVKINMDIYHKIIWVQYKFGETHTNFNI